jgi:hypothetical protein
MMMNEESKNDLTKYIIITLVSAIALFCIITFAILLAYLVNATYLIKHFIGGLIGLVLATLNLFAIGYVFLATAIKKGSRWSILWAIFTFMMMSVAAFVLAFYFPQFILGFAISLTVPVFFAAIIVWAFIKPV